MPPSLPMRVVLTPEALGRALLDARAAGFFAEWREGRVLLVVNRSLCVRYLRLLHRLGLPERTLRWWGWWLGGPPRAEVVEGVTDAEAAAGTTGLCAAIARRAGVAWLLHGGLAGEEGVVSEEPAVRRVAVWDFPAEVAQRPAS